MVRSSPREVSWGTCRVHFSGVYITRAVSKAESQKVGECPGLDQERGKSGVGTEDLRQRNKGTGTGGGRRGS